MTIEEKTERSLARIAHADIGEVYNGMVGLSVTFDYDDGGCQGLGGYMIEAGMIVRFMKAVGVLSLSDAVGKSCWVTHSHSKVYRVEPLHKKDGTTFDIDEWSAWVNERFPDGPSYHELETGKRRCTDE